MTSRFCEGNTRTGLVDNPRRAVGLTAKECEEEGVAEILKYWQSRGLFALNLDPGP